MGKKNNDFDDFLMFKTITSGGGCLVSTLAFIGTVFFLIMLAV